MLEKHLTDQILKAYYKVYNELGYGFLEKVYERAIMHELRKAGVVAYAQQKIEVMYDGIIVGEFVADILVGDTVIVEIKARETILQEHNAQLINYLKATSLEVGLLLNFGKKADFNRVVFSNSRKKNPRSSAY